MIRYKTTQELKLLREGGKHLARILAETAALAKAGVTTEALDTHAEKQILAIGGRPAFKGYGDPPFPGTLCLSVNDELVHTPASRYQLKDGDILSIDIGMQYPANGGLFTDMATTVTIGTVSSDAQKLLTVTKESLNIGIAQVKPGNFVHDISKAIQTYVEAQGYSVIYQLVGHGVGHAVHEDPRVPNVFSKRQPVVELKPGLVIAIEPMVSIGEPEVETLDDGWTIVMADGSLCAHFEHTVAVTKSGVEIITKA